MGIFPIIGKPKSGKTLFLAANWCFSDYDTYYSNIALKGHKYKLIRTVEDILNIPQDSDSKGIFIDELQQMGADSWSYDALADIVSRLGTQHRKYHADFWFTTQHLNQIINRIRENREDTKIPTNIIFDDVGKPRFMDVSIIDNDFYGRDFIRPDSDFWFPLFGKFGYVCDMYDTYEFVKPMEDYNLTLMNRLKLKYKDFCLWKPGRDGNLREDAAAKRALKTKLIYEESCAKGLACDIVNMVSGIQGGFIKC